jgi:hypothetical protein
VALAVAVAVAVHIPPHFEIQRKEKSKKFEKKSIMYA